MVVNAENISRVMDYVWHDVNGRDMMKCHQRKTTSSAIEFRRIFQKHPVKVVVFDLLT